MSATVETNAASASAWRKRLREDDTTTQMDLKRPRYYYYRLESESSKASEEDTESVYSLQDRETDFVKDTTDTDSKSGDSDQDEYEVHYEEYEVASLSGSDNGFSDSNSSSDGRYSEGMMLAAAAAAICDSSLETWITDCEDSDNSSLDEASFGKTDFSKCIQCKSENDNPLYRYCEKCFQSCKQCKKRKTFKCFPLCIYCYKDRKKLFPPRPKRNRKSRNMKKKKKQQQQQQKEPPVKLAMLRSYLKDLSQDSGIGSSQEWPVLDLAQIVVPDEHLTPGTSQITTVNETKEASGDVKPPDAEVVTEAGEKSPDSSASSKLKGAGVERGRKRPLSESSLSDFEVKPKQPKVDEWSDLGPEISTGSVVASPSSAVVSSDSSELCIMCNDAPKDAIFLHSKVAHQCCCYSCAKRTIKTIKRCPICNVTVNKVFRVIKS